MLILDFDFERAWQAQFLSHTHKIFKKCVFFRNEKMMLLPFFCNVPQNPTILEKPNFILKCQPTLVRFYQSGRGFPMQNCFFRIEDF